MNVVPDRHYSDIAFAEALPEARRKAKAAKIVNEGLKPRQYVYRLLTDKVAAAGNSYRFAP
jgi:hypothetical protein